MKSKYLFFLAIAAVCFQCDGQNKKSTTASASGVALKNKADSVGYSLGYNLGEFLKANGVKDLPADVNTDVMVKAIKVALANQKSPMTRDECSMAINSFVEGKRTESITKNK